MHRLIRPGPTPAGTLVVLRYHAHSLCDGRDLFTSWTTITQWINQINPMDRDEADYLSDLDTHGLCFLALAKHG